MRTIRYRSNLSAGCLSILAAAVLFWLIPTQVSAESQSVHGITSQTVPYALCALMAFCGICLVFQSLVLKKDEIKELDLGKEGKGVLYMLVLLVYGIGFSYSFLIATCLLGVATLAFSKCKKVSYYLIVIAMVILLYFTFTELLHVRLP